MRSKRKWWLMKISADKVNEDRRCQPGGPQGRDQHQRHHRKGTRRDERVLVVAHKARLKSHELGEKQTERQQPRSYPTPLASGRARTAREALR